MGRVMERRILGQSGLQVPAIGMGTSRTFGVKGPDAEAIRHEIVSEALVVGASFFDSSPMYGEAERVLSQGLQGRREQALVATKVWAQSVEEGQRQVEQSLRYYGGRIDLY